MFEKRQRLREKEKLQHEHYKLKERIDQLRAMDHASFLALPESHFTTGTYHKMAVDVSDPSADQSLDPTSQALEGERRKQQLLQIAVSLEERYRALLTPKGSEKAINGHTSSLHESIPLPESRGRVNRDDEDRNSAEEAPAHRKDKSGIKIRLPPPQRAHPSTKSPASAAARHERLRISSSPLRVPNAPSKPPPAPDIEQTHIATPEHTMDDVVVDDVPAPSIPDTSVVALSEHSLKGHSSLSNGTATKPLGASSSVRSSTPILPLSAPPHVPYARKPRQPAILVAAARYQDPSARKSGRSRDSAFGVEVPEVASWELDFEIPLWARPGYRHEEESFHEGMGSPSFSDVPMDLDMEKSSPPAKKRKSQDRNSVIEPLEDPASNVLPLSEEALHVSNEDTSKCVSDGVSALHNIEDS